MKRTRGFSGVRGPAARTGAEGSALIVVVVVSTVLAALGLGVLAIGTLETAAASHALASRQAACAAESGLRLVKHWFDAPAGTAGAGMVPTAAEVDRTMRRIDLDEDGTFVPFASAPPPGNVVYRQAQNDLFEPPYHGDPALSLQGDPGGPDMVIADDAADTAVRAFLDRLNGELFAAGQGGSVRIRRIKVWGPPRAWISGVATRVGIASIEVEAVVTRAAGAQIVAAARASGVLQEIYPPLPGPLITPRSIEDGSGLDLRWGTVLVGADASWGADPAAALRAGWPWRAIDRRLVADAESDGTVDDTDGDGAGDLDEWLGLTDDTIEDPWLRVLVAGSLAGAPAGATHPWPFDPSAVPGPFTSDHDASNLFQGVAAVIAGPDAPLVRAAAAERGPTAHLFHYIGGTDPPLFREADGPPVDFQTATAGREGLFFFDTADGLPPRDDDGDGDYDNLTPGITVEDPDWSARGCLFVNAETLSLHASAKTLTVPLAPPGEPWADRDADGTCDDDEFFLRLSYPVDPVAPGAGFGRIGLATLAGGASRLAEGPTSTGAVSFAGILLTTGRFEGGAGARLFGAVIASGPVRAPATSDPPMQILFDARMGRGAWPGPASRLPRTTWQSISLAR